jgi:hypothetical protein
MSIKYTVSNKRGILNSSLFCNIKACFGSKTLAEGIPPINTIKLLNCLAREIKLI